MSDACFLITLLNGDSLLRCALKIPLDFLPRGCADAPMEPENRAVLRSWLPHHVADAGPIVQVEPLFDVHVGISR